MKPYGAALVGVALAVGAVAWRAPAPAQVVGQAGAGAPTPIHNATIVYTAPTSGTWGPSGAAAPTFAFGKPAEVLYAVPGGYVVRQVLPVDQALEHATYVARQVGQPIAVTIPDPTGGPARVEYVGRSAGDIGK